MGCVKIFDTNYVDVDLLASYTESSEKAAFPVENAFNLQRRSKIWRSNGYYNVTASNNVIYFNDGGSNLSATITVGEYTSTASFMTAVDTALESVGVANYTVTQNSNFKFVITSDLSGGATAFQLLTSNASFTAEGLLGFDNAADKTGASTYTADYMVIHTGEFIRFDMGISSLPSCFAMIGKRNQGIQLTQNGTFTLKGNFTNTFTSPAYSQVLEYDDEVISVFSETTLHTVGLRYWQIEFNDPTNPNGYVELGAIFLGTYFEPTRGAVQFPLQSRFIDRSNVVFSEGGQTFSDIFEQSQQYQINWMGLQKGDIENITDFFRLVGKNKPFFILLDSDEGFSTEYQRTLKFVKFESEPTYQLESFDNFSMNMTLREEL